MHSLKVNKAAGLDEIPARLVRDAEVELAPSLTYLINKSITDRTVPALWKVARVTALYKSEDKLLVASSLTHSACFSSVNSAGISYELLN